MKTTNPAMLVAPLLLLQAAAQPAHADDPKLSVRSDAKYGAYLVNGEGRALYLFTKDTRGQGSGKAKSACRDACATAWPPFTAAATPAAGQGVKPGLIGTIQRKGGETQITYNGWPLYEFAGDEGKGEATGQDIKGFGGEWYLLTPAGAKVGHKAAMSGESAAAEDGLFKDANFKAPECVLYDAPRDRYIVSNINGKMRGYDGNGFISLLSPDGTVTKRRWISADTEGVTLNAPKGMAISGGELHVADIDQLRTFDLESGEPVRSVRFEDARFLNDIAVGADGTLFVTDSGTKDAPGAIYAVALDGAIRKIAEGRKLHRPNGIDVDSDGNLVVVTFGDNRVLRISPKGQILETGRLEAGQLDGLVLRKDGSRLVSSWKGKHVVHVTPDGKERAVLSNATTPAAFDVDTRRNRLLVPLVRENRLEVVPLG